MSSRIEQCIDEIETYIDSCKHQPLSHGNIIVNKEEIDDLLRELRSKTPDEIRRYQTIISNKESILEDARKKAKDLIDKATEQTHAMINEHDIMQQAYAQANEVIAHAAKQAEEILTKSTNEANQMKAAAVAYTDNLLAEVEVIVNKAIDTTNASNNALLRDLTAYSETIKSNRADLIPPSVNPSNVKETAKVSSTVSTVTPEGSFDDEADLNLDML
ncbi:HrpE/YscL family type III secretion apparatus protein [Butyrivibrio sp. AE3004]|uniref:HrpE/YscL family type III secretion apparatus protein n=1 Tax=Butyrivibrio sp. AE3004 TaxID=1506994 RepID=UPI0005661564|nr:HrpE/YscL family type III secretion apparatus protein [Butyrivibrio sp. AE3004]